MTAKTFWNKRTGAFLGSLVRRNLALSALIFGVGFVCMPLQFLLTAILNSGANQAGSMNPVFGLGGLYTASSLFLMPVLWVACAAVAGLMQISYMHNRRAVDVYHALPLTRPQLLCAEYLSAFLAVAVPMAANYLLTLILSFVRCSRFEDAEFAPGAALLGLCLWLVSLAGMLSVCFLVSTQTGSVFDTLIFTGVLLAAPLFLALVHIMMCNAFLYGFAGGINYKLFLRLSPLTLGAMDSLGSVVAFDDFSQASGITCFVWALASAVLLAAACRLYTRRPSERAESPSRTGLLALLIRVLAMLILCPVGGYVFAVSAADEPTIQLVLLGTVLCGLLGFLILEAVLNRGTKGLLKTFPLGVCLTALVTAYMAALCTGGLGYETWQPGAESIESVIVNYRGQFEYADHLAYESDTQYVNYTGNVELHSAQAIESVLRLQADAVADHRESGRLRANSYFTDPDGLATKSLYITYTLKNGKGIQRGYNTVRLTPAVLQDYIRLADCEEMNSLCNPLQNTTAADYYAFTLTGALTPGSETISDPDAMDTLLSALRNDTARLGLAGMIDEHARVLAVMQLETRQPQPGQPQSADYWADYSIQITESCPDTIAALQNLGYGALLESKAPAFTKVYAYENYYSDGYFASEETGYFLVNAFSQTALKELVQGGYYGYEFLEFSAGEYDLQALSALGRLRGPEGQQGLVTLIFETQDGALTLPMYVNESELRAAGFGTLADVLLGGEF